MTDNFGTLIRWGQMRDEIQRIVEGRQRTDRLGSEWRISDVKAPEYFGVNGKSVIYVDEAAERYEVHVFDFSGKGGCVASYKTIDAALRSGEKAVA